MSTFQRIKPGDLIKSRIKAIKGKLPDRYKSIIAERHPEYNTIKGAELIDRVMRTRTSDVRLTEILEEIAAEHMAELKKSEGTAA